MSFKMKRLQRIVSVKGRKNDAESETHQHLQIPQETQRPFPGFKRTNLQRTKSRSEECMKFPTEQRQQLLRKSVLRSYRGRNNKAKNAETESASDSADSNSSLSTFHHSRSQSHYGMRHKNSPLTSVESSPGLLRATRSVRAMRCGSTPPVGGKPPNADSLTSIYGRSTVNQPHEEPDFLSSLSAIGPRLQSEEVLDRTRKQEVTWMNTSRIREETTILKNIKKRELIELKKKELVIPIKKDKESELFARASTALPVTAVIGGPAPQPVAPTTKVAAETASRSLFKSLFQKEGEPKSIASGLMGTKAILLAPTAATLIDPSMTHNGGGPNGQQNKNGDKAEKITKWIPPPQLKPKERNLVRKIISARLLAPQQPSVTKFLETDFTQDCLKWHNKYRKLHQAPPLDLDEQLCASAQYWANILAHKDEFFHERPDDLGENLFAWPVPVVPESSLATKMPDIAGKDVAVYWYKTMRNYYFFKDKDVLHTHAAQFSQMIWVSTKKFGCGKARSRSGKVIVVAHYFPKGNIPGEFKENVLLPDEDESDSDL